MEVHSKIYRRSWLLIIPFFLLIWVGQIAYQVYPLSQGESLWVTRWLNKEGKTQVLVGPNEPGWVDYGGVSLFALYSVLVAEDARFYHHRGIDLEEIRESVILNLKAGRIVRGASTISQQVIKLLFLPQDKTWNRKLYEMVGAFFLERFLSKEDILAWYINLLPLGPGIYGIKEAAQCYFDTDPQYLTVSQGVQLALLIPSPNTRSRFLKMRHLDPAQEKRYQGILDQMKQTGYITQLQWEEALASGNFGEPIGQKGL
jgi:monofunctional biosynthetic peptidoglycan transglycosylase